MGLPARRRAVRPWWQTPLLPPRASLLLAGLAEPALKTVAQRSQKGPGKHLLSKKKTTFQLQQPRSAKSI